MNDVRKIIYGTLIGFFAVLLFWFSVIYISSCGLTLTCRQATPKVDRTPIPTLIPAGRTESQTDVAAAEFNKCEVSARDLIGAWVSADSPESDPFPFSNMNGQPCEGSFARDIQPLFVENSLWYAGAIGCVSCHNSALTERSAGLDLTSYDVMLLGSGRADENAKGKDIFGGGNWEASRLHAILMEKGFAPQGHSADNPPDELILYAGEVAEVTATPTP